MLTSKLQYLEETKKAIKEALIAKGADVTDETTFRDYATKISEITDVSDEVLVLLDEINGEVITND